MTSAALIIVAGGSGARMGRSDVPKQLMRLGDRTILDWSIEAAQNSGMFTAIVLVWPKNALEAPAWQAWHGATHHRYKDLVFIEGGSTRTESVRAGMNALTATISPPEIVLIHDAARPGVDTEIIDALISAVTTGGADCAAPMLPIVDALKRIDDASIPHRVDRTNLNRIQTPQAFKFEILNTCLNSLENTNQNFDDDISALMALADAKFMPVHGSEKLRKLTYPEDLTLLESMLLPRPLPINIRIGHGYDVHAFEGGKHVTLCGVDIPHTHKLAGHSDADVGWHALTDAILGALALGDIGDHFPPSDPQWKGVASHVFLRHAKNLAAKANYDIANADITLVCETPKIAPHRGVMRQATADVLGLDLGQISIKATTTEKLGFTGRREGIAAQASVLLQSKPNN